MLSQTARYFVGAFLKIDTSSLDRMLERSRDTDIKSVKSLIARTIKRIPAFNRCAYWSMLFKEAFKSHEATDYRLQLNCLAYTTDPRGR